MSNEIPSALSAGLKFLRYIGEPYGIIPITIKNGTKRPMVKIKDNLGNVHRLDDKEYLKAWDDAEYYGIVTSPRFNPDIKKQLFIIDVDVPSEGGHDNDGRIHLDKLSIPDTFTVTTPSGGIHYYLWTDLGQRFKHAPYPGIDIVHMSPFYAVGVGNTGYELINKKPIADAPIELIEELRYVNEQGETEKRDDKTSILNEIMTNGIPSGQRHNTILRLMASLVRRRIPKTEAMAIAELAIGKCDQSDGLPTLEEASAQYDDAMQKFTVGSTLDDLLDDLVLLTGDNVVKRISKPTEVAISATALSNVYPQRVPNLNLPPNKNGDFQMSPLGRVWLDSPDKKQASTEGYFPCPDPIFNRHGNRFFNKYQPPMIQTVTNYDQIAVRKFQDVFKRTYGPIYEDWLKIMKYKWLHPYTKFAWSIYLTSRYEGTGKGLSWKLTQELFHKSNCLSLNVNDIGARFNVSLSEATFALVDEAHGARNPSHRNNMMNAIKRVITEETMTTEGKNKEKQIGVESYFFMYIFSNDRTALEISKDSRRFLVYHDEEPKTVEQEKRMYQVGDMLRDPTKVADFLSWMIQEVDCSITDDFNPLGVARKTDDLMSSSQDVYLSPEAQKVKDDIEHRSNIFFADLVTRTQLEYYSLCEFGQNKAYKIVQELLDRSVVKTISAPTPKNPRQVKRYNLEPLDMTLARDGMDIRDSYKMSDGKRQTPILCVRNHDEYEIMDKSELKKRFDAEIGKNGPRKSGGHLTTVD